MDCKLDLDLSLLLELSKQLEFVLFDRITKRLATINQALLVKDLILLYSKFFSRMNRLGSFFIHDVTCVKIFLGEWIPLVCDDLSEVRYLSGRCLLDACSLFMVPHLCTLLAVPSLH